ncbi:MAG: hypothetical protein H6729_16225 [Deltaproteobacteria bacterium]|nr:hypothetical protein [Deltaproteobacteria bacterium]
MDNAHSSPRGSASARQMRARRPQWLGGRLLACLALELGFLSAVGGCDSLWSGPDRVLGEDLKLSTAWTDLSFEKPLEVRGIGQKVLMALPRVKDWRKPGGPLLLDDGTEVSVDVEISTVEGKTFVLIPNSIGASIGFGLETPEKGAGFDKARRFSRLRIRASRELGAKRVVWHTWVAK